MRTGLCTLTAPPCHPVHNGNLRVCALGRSVSVMIHVLAVPGKTFATCGRDVVPPTTNDVLWAIRCEHQAGLLNSSCRCAPWLAWPEKASVCQWAFQELLFSDEPRHVGVWDLLGGVLEELSQKVSRYEGVWLVLVLGGSIQAMSCTYLCCDFWDTPWGRTGYYLSCAYETTTFIVFLGAHEKFDGRHVGFGMNDLYFLCFALAFQGGSSSPNTIHLEFDEGFCNFPVFLFWHQFEKFVLRASSQTRVTSFRTVGHPDWFW